MNKKIILISILLVLFVVIAIIFVNKKSKGDDEDMLNEVSGTFEKLDEINVNDINSIKYIFYTEGGATEKVVMDSETISQIYNLLKNVKIVKLSNMATEDDGLTIIINVDNENIKYVFEGNNIVIDRKGYEVENYKALKSYLKNLD